MPGRHLATPRGSAQRNPFAIIEENPTDLAEEDALPPWAQSWDESGTDRSSGSSQTASSCKAGKQHVQPIPLASSAEEEPNVATKARLQRSRAETNSSKSSYSSLPEETLPTATATQLAPLTVASTSESSSSTRPGTIDVPAVSSTAPAASSTAPSALGPEPLMPAVHRVPPAAKALAKKLVQAPDFFPDVPAPARQTSRQVNRKERARVCDNRERICENPEPEMLSLPLPLFTVRRNCGMFPLLPARDTSASLTSSFRSSVCAWNKDDSSDDGDADSENESSSSAGSSW